MVIDYTSLHTSVDSWHSKLIIINQLILQSILIL